MRVAVVGSGLVGLVTGIALREAGHEVTVHERHGEIRAEGAGIMLWPNATDVLDLYGVAGAVLDAGCVAPMRPMSVSGALSGSWGVRDTAAGFGWPPLLIYRPVLSALLAERLGRDAIRLGARFVEARTTPEGTLVHFADGEQHTVDLLVGADGIWSTVRAGVDPEASPTYSRQVIWRGVLKDPSLTRGYRTFDAASGLRAGVTPVGGGLVYWFVGRFGTDPVSDTPATSADVLKLVGEWPHVAPLVARTADADILATNVHVLRSIGRWVNGRTVLVGDAAHAESPHVSIGACLGIEDAYVLARELRVQANDVSGALSAYAAQRSPRLEWIQSVAASTEGVGQSEAAQVLSALEDEVMESAPVRCDRQDLDEIVHQR